MWLSLKQKVFADYCIEFGNATEVAKMLAKRYGILIDKIQIKDITSVVIGGEDDCI